MFNRPEFTESTSCYLNKFPRSTRLYNSTTVKHNDSIKEVHDHFKSMRHHDNSVIFKLIADNLLHRLVRHLVNTAAHLIQKKQPALLLSPGESIADSTS
ncbi:hypothetical protein HG530_002650 [Fusarium avenaceum]|nr:hypothetical protein HG530_002650 [Fusarium avenaceum]